MTWTSVVCRPFVKPVFSETVKRIITNVVEDTYPPFSRHFFCLLVFKNFTFLFLLFFYFTVFILYYFILFYFCFR